MSITLKSNDGEFIDYALKPHYLLTDFPEQKKPNQQGEVESVINQVIGNTLVSDWQLVTFQNENELRLFYNTNIKPKSKYDDFNHKCRCFFSFERPIRETLNNIFPEIKLIWNAAPHTTNIYCMLVVKHLFVVHE